MTDTVTISRPYAEAAYKIASESKKLDVWSKNLSSLSEVIVDGKIDVTSYQPLARLGYMDYAQITTLFEMKRPTV